MTRNLVSNSESRLHLTHRWEYALLLFILLSAAFFRLHRLQVVPPGLTHDEADFSYDAIAVYHGARPLYVATHGYQDEPLMHYASAAMMTLVGPSYLAVRATSALFGVVLVWLTFLWTRMVFGKTVALGAAAWLAVSYWPVSTSRFAVQIGPTASFFVLTCLFFWLGMGLRGRKSDAQLPGRGRVLLYWSLFALGVTASFYAYEANRITWFLFPLFNLYLLLKHPDLVRRNWWKIALALVVAVLLALPLLTHPAAWNRAGQLAGPVEALRRGSFGPLFASIRDVLAMFTLKGDPFVTYNLPERPILDPITSLLFYGGVLLCLRRWRIPAYIFVLFWLVVGVAPSMVTKVHGASLRSIVAQPALYIIPALALAELSGWLCRRFNLQLSLVVLAGLVLIITGNGWITYRDYFVRWARSPETQQAYFSDLFQAVRYLDKIKTGQIVVISSPFPNLPHDPYIARVMPNQHNLDLRWVDGRRALIFPSNSSSVPNARLIVLSRSPLNPLLEDALDNQLLSQMQVEGTENFIEMFEWNPTNTLEQVRRTYGSMTVEIDEGLRLPVDFGHSVQLIGYSLKPSSIIAGETIQVVTLWRVIGPEPLGPVPLGYYGYDAVIFVHLLNDNRQVVAQEDRLDVPAWGWQNEDSFVQIHRLTTAPELLPGQYDIEIGLYTQPDLRRLPVYANGESRGDFFLLKPVEVTSP